MPTKTVTFEGVSYLVPADATDEEIFEFIEGEIAAGPQGPEQPPFSRDYPEPMTPIGSAVNMVTSTKDLVRDAGAAVKGAVTPWNEQGDWDVPPTLKALGSVAVDVWRKITGPEPAPGAPPSPVDAIVDSLKERYGSWDDIRYTAYHDPAGFAADLSIVIGAAGGAMRGAAGMLKKAGTAAPKLAAAGATAGEAGALLDPVQAVVRGAAAAGRTVARAVDPYKIYQSAMKPAGFLGSNPDLVAKGNRAIRTGVDQGIVVNQKGIDSIGPVIEELNGQISMMIEKGATKGMTVDPTAVVKTLDEVIDRFRTVNPNKNMRAIIKAREEFLKSYGAKIVSKREMFGLPADDPLRNARQQIPLKEAQALKVKTGRVLRKAYGELKDANKEAQKALVRGLKEEIAAAFPEISDINALESELFNITPFLERAVKRINNRDLIQLTTTTAGTGGAVIGGMAGGAGFAAAGAGLAAVIRSVLENPTVKSRIAILIRKAQVGRGGRTASRTLPQVSPAARIEEYRQELIRRMDSYYEQYPEGGWEPPMSPAPAHGEQPAIQ